MGCCCVDRRATTAGFLDVLRCFVVLGADAVFAGGVTDLDAEATGTPAVLAAVVLAAVVGAVRLCADFLEAVDLDPLEVCALRVTADPATQTQAIQIAVLNAGKRIV